MHFLEYVVFQSDISKVPVSTQYGEILATSIKWILFLKTSTLPTI